MTTTYHVNYDYYGPVDQYAFTIPDDYHFIIDRGFDVVSPTDVGIVTNNRDVIDVYGSVIGLYAIGLYGTGSQVIIEAGGKALGSQNGIYMGDVSVGSTLTNHGTISSAATGVYIDATSGVTTINNSGTIIGGPASQGGHAILGVEGSTLKIVNTGKIVGSVDLFGGNDFYDGHAGHHSDGEIEGYSGNDTLYGGADNDDIAGDYDNDLIRGGGGKDTMDGGPGTGDIVDYTDKTQKVQLTLQGASLASVLVNGAAEDSISNFEFVRGGSAGDAFTGDNLANLLSGFGGNDVLIGTGGADVLIGGAGADHLYGNTAAALNDAAKDSFNYSAITDSGVTTATEDVIYGAFNGGAAGGDKIDIGAVATGAGAALAFSFVTGAFTDAGQVHVSNAGTNTYLVSLNTDADAAAEMSIVVHTPVAHTFTGGDFVL